MKKINLIKRLLSNSHEKQSPQRFARYAAMLIMLLTLGVGQMWANTKTDIGGDKFYFNNSNIKANDGNNVSSWQVSGGYTYFNFWGGNSSGGYTSKQTASSVTGDVYKINFPSGNHASVQLVRGNSSNNWNHTYEIDAANFANGKNYFWCSDGNYYYSYYVEDAYVYFDNSNANWGTGGNYIYCNVGRYNYTSGGNNWKMVNITNTKIYYKRIQNFADYDRYRFCNTSNYNEHNSAMSETPSVSGYTAIVQNSSDVLLKYNSHNLFTYSGSNGSAVTKNEVAAYDDLNKTITIKEKYNSTGEGTYAEVSSGTTHGTITVSGNKFGSWTTCAASSSASITKETSTYSANAKFGRTSTITLTAGVTKEGKAFVGWYRSNGSLISANTETTYEVGSSNETVYAYYKDEETHNVTISYKCGPYTIKAQDTESAVGISTTRSVTAPSITGYHFVSWTLGSDVTSTNGTSTNPIIINTVHDGSDFTLTANYGVSSGWYLIGTDFGNTWTTGYTTNQFAGSYRGSTDIVYYPVASLSTNYWKVHDGSNLYNTKANADQTITTTTIYSLSQSNSGGASKVGSAQSNVWIVLDKRNSPKKLWVQSEQTYHNVNVSGADGAKGAVSVTLNSTSAFDKSSISELATTQFANGETFKVTVTGVSGWIPTITIGSTPTTFWKEAASYSATGTMSTSDVAVSISYTASYAVTFAMTTGCGTLSAKGPGDVAISTGNKVKSGTSITFTQTSTHSGYDFQKWYSTSSGTSGTQWGTETSLTKSITAATSVYPIYTVHTYTGGTLDKKEGGEDGSYSVTYLATSFASKTAPTRTGYNVSGYYQEDGRSTLVADASGNLKTGTSYTNGSRQWTYTSSIPTLYTGWTAKTYAVTLDKNGTSSGYLTNGSATATYDATSLSSLSAPTRTGYHVEGYYDDNVYSNKVATDEGALQSGVTGFTTGTAWTKDADATLYTKWTANSYTIKFDKNTDGLTTYVGAVSGTTADKAATYDASCTLTSNGYSREGYEFRGWNTDADTTGTRYTDGQSGTFNFTSTNGGTTTLYAMWKSKTYTVTFDARGGTSLSASSATVTMGDLYINGSGLGGDLPTVTAPAGYVFQGWYTASSGGTLVTDETRVATASDHTLYAHYIQQTRVYFKNTLNWSEVYVTYDATWHNDQGAGNVGKIYHKMTLLDEEEKIYVDVIPEDIIRSWKYNIAFNSKQLGKINDDWTGDYTGFNSGSAVFRRDFDSYATMFVPETTKDYDKNYTAYYSTDQWTDKDDKEAIIDYRYKDGYWRTYNEKECGYVVKGTWDSESKDHAFRNADPTGNTFSFTRTLEANTDYYFRIYKHCNTSNTYSSWFIANDKATITSSITDWTLSTAIAKTQTSRKDHIKTTAAGDYTITLKLGTNGVIKIDVTYPLVANDYRVLYSWNDGSAHEHASEIIKPEASSSKKISVFIHKVEGSVVSRSLKIQQCTAINASGVPTWTDRNTIDLSSVTASGVYNFVITQPAEGYPTGAYSEAYDGDYYIRTECAEGKWDFYKEYPDNKMTYSDYSMTQTLSPQYSHYFCRYFGDSRTPEQTDIAYTIANDYSPSISDTLVGDATIGERNTLPTGHPANVRFAWNEKTNALRRAYLKSATGSGNKRYLLIHGNNKIFNNDNDGTAIASKGEHADSLHANELQFIDKGNWIYQVELKAQPQAAYSLIAKYNGVDRDLIGNTASSEFATIIGGSGSNKYAITAVYDFKTNRLMTAWTPSEDIEDNITNVDVMLIREGAGSGNAITFGEGGSLTTNKIIGAIKLDYDDLVGRVADWTSASRPLLKYFISFPFAVNVSDIFGMGRLGREYIIQRYNGAERARKGFFRGDGTTTFWENLTADDVMNAYEGYCVIFDNDYLNDAGSEVWTNKGSGSSVYLYFPSADNVGAISNTDKTIPVPEHECKIERTFIEGGKTLSHQNTDSHWNLIGVPIFNNHEGDATAGTPGAIFVKNDGDEDGDGNFHYYYEFNPNNTFSIAAARGKTFNSMHCYMVQYHGDVTFTGSAPTPAGIAARRTPENKNYKIELQVTNGKEETTNHTYVELRENASDEFALNEDVYMDLNNVATSIYSYAGDYDVAANVLSVANHTVSVGINVVQEGMCTFSMPSNFSGTVTLIDKFAQTRTNLALEDYEVYLNKGAINDRFELEIDINKMPTAIDGVEGGSLKDGKAHKFIENGQMYILRDGKVFDARGNRVK